MSNVIPFKQPYTDDEFSASCTGSQHAIDLFMALETEGVGLVDATVATADALLEDIADSSHDVARAELQAFIQQIWEMRDAKVVA